PRRDGPWLRRVVVKGHYPRRVIGHALGAPVGENRKLIGGMRVEPAAKARLTRTLQVMDRAAHERCTFLAAALTRELLGLEAAWTPYVAACAMARMQGPEGHVEPASGEPRINDTAAESIDLLVERQALQSPLHQPCREAGEIEWRQRARQFRRWGHGLTPGGRCALAPLARCRDRCPPRVGGRRGRRGAEGRTRTNRLRRVSSLKQVDA